MSGAGRWRRASILPLLGVVLAALAFLVVGRGAPEAGAVAPPPAVAEYDFGGPGPVGDLTWGGRTVSVDISPANASVAIAAAATGGLWRTTDGGATWNFLSGFPMLFPHDAAYDPNDPNIVYATVNYEWRVNSQGGIWRSTDGGDTWSRTSATYPCTTEPTATGIGTVAGSDTHHKVFAANSCGVAYSNNSGTSWTNVDPSGGTPTEFFDVAAVRTGTDTALAYACSGAAGLYSATVTGNAAPVWTPVSTAPPITNPAAGSDWCQVAISPLDSNVVFVTNTNCPVSGPCPDPAFGARVYEVDIDTSATPSAVTVTDLNGPVKNNREPYVLTHRAVDGDASHFDLYFSNGELFYRQHCSSDGNPATLDCPVTAEAGAQCTNVVDDDGDQMINEGCPAVGNAENGGAVPSQCKNAADDDGDGAVNDGCAVMEHFDNGTHVDPTDIAFDPTVPGGTGCPLLTTNDGGVGRSTDCGASWTNANAGMRALQIYNIWGTLRGTGATDTDLYFGTHDNQWWYTLDNGGTWTNAGMSEGFLGQADYRVPPGGLNDIRMVFVNCADCYDNTAGRGFSGVTAWPYPPGQGGYPIMFGPQRYIQSSTDLASAPNYQLYIMQPEAGAQCANSSDDDLDTGFQNAGAGAANDGCPADGAPETGAQCHNNTDNDGDGKVNDGCSHIFSVESGAECTNATDDDGDGVVNDGCPKVGSFSEAGALCLDATDDPDEDKNAAGSQDDDTTVNDGCPQVGVWGPMGPSFTEPLSRYPIVPSGPYSGPTFYFGVESPANNWKLRKMTGPMNSSATISDASGTGLGILGGVLNVGNQFYWPLVYAVDPQNPAHLWAADNVINQMKYSNDGGMTWHADEELTALVTNNGEFTFSPWRIVWDPEDSQRILVSTRLAGIAATVNGGKDWFKLRGSEALPMVTSFFFDRDHDVVYASTFGRGLWTVTLPQADLSVSKTDWPDPVTAGTELFYTITATNNGPEPATVEVVDTLPAEVEFVDDNLAPPLGCTEAPVGTLTCDLGALDVSQSRSFQVKVQVKPDAVVATGPKAIFNTVNVTSTDTTDPDTTNNSATDPTFVEDLADLRVTKLCKPDQPLLAGETATCTIYVDNLGPSDARSVTLTDANLSVGVFTIGTVTASQGSCTKSDSVVTCNLGNLAAASPSVSGRATVTVDLTANEATDINDVATAVSDTPDPDTSNNQAQGSVSVTAVADLSLTKSDSPDPVVAGTNLTYTANVTNSGPSTAVNVVVEDVLPVGISIVSVSSSGASSCNAGTPGDPFLPTTCTYDSLAPGASRTMTINATVLPGTTGILHNDARVYSATFDNNNANDLAHTDTTVQVQADVAVSKAATPNPVVAGTALSYQITVGNAGPSTAAGLVLTDPLPASLALTSTSVSDSAGSCGLQTNTNTVQCSLPDLDPGQNVVVFIYTMVSASAPDGSTIDNTATIGAATPDPDTADNSSTVTTNVIARADLAITLTSDKDSYKPSTVIHYTITVVNAGPSDAQNVVVTQMLPPKKTGFYVSNDAGCPAPSGGVFTCALGTIPAGGTRTFQLNYFVRGNKGTITQTATVTSSTTDLNTVNNSWTRIVTVK